MQNLTLGSLFDGSGGFPLGGMLAGITPVWASEIEPFPIRVTTKRLPFMKHYGDISSMDGSKIEPVDIITFGSPCTDMSVAGKRAGLEGKQSILFYQAIRIITEMRCATNGKYPRWICWENVPGAFSSNSGYDFKAVLEAIIGIAAPGAEVPMPANHKWPHADVYMGPGFSVAYRTLDSQYWGLAQRRKRIFLVGDLNGGCAGTVLFKSEGLSGYSPESFRAWQRAARSSADCTGAAVGCVDGIVLNDQGGSRMDVTREVTCTLRAEAHHPPCIMEENLSVFDNHSQDTRFVGPVDVAPTVSRQYGTGGNNQPFVVSNQIPFGIGADKSCGMLSDNPHAGYYEADTSRTLDASGGNPACHQGGIAIVESYSIQGSMIGRDNKNGPQGDGINKNVSFTLNTVDRHAVYSMTTGSFTQVAENIAPTVLARDYKDPTTVCYGIGRDTFNHSKNSPFAPTFVEEVQPTLVAKGPGAVQRGYTVRRLTPTECARLQGFPDWWCGDLGTSEPTEEDISFWTEVWETHRRIVSPDTKPKTRNQIIKWIKDPYSDAAEYKMWGNGVALPCVYFVLAGIAYVQKCEVESA